MVAVVRIGAASLLLLAALAAAAAAVDQPIDGRYLKLRDYGAPGKTVLTFVASDPEMLVPGIASFNNPSWVNPLRIDIFTGAETRRLEIPVGRGNPGWRVRQGRGVYFLYTGSSTGNDDLVKIVLREGGTLKMRVRGLDLGDKPPLGAMAIRVVTGNLRNCAVFRGSSVLRAEPGVFLAADASALSLADCDDTTIAAVVLGVPCSMIGELQCGGVCPDGSICSAADFLPEAGCRCFSPQEPCGSTAAVCNGTCPLGEQCWATGDFIPSWKNCVCSPLGLTPCGAPGGTHCPSGSSCKTVLGRLGTYQRCVLD